MKANKDDAVNARLKAEINEALKSAFETGDSAREPAQKVCELHKQWLCFYYPDYHKGLGEMYGADERFAAYYDKTLEGCSKFLHEAIVSN